MIILSPEEFKAFEYVQSITAILTASGALFSATWIINSYKLNLLNFYETNRPQLLIQVRTGHQLNRETGEKENITFIQYKNISLHQLINLNIYVYLQVYDKKTLIGGLFSENMNMLGGDDRTRWFSTFNKFDETSPEINDNLLKLHPPKLIVEFDYLYAKQVYRNTAGEYIWNNDLQEWQIY